MNTSTTSDINQDSAFYIKAIARLGAAHLVDVTVKYAIAGFLAFLAFHWTPNLASIPADSAEWVNHSKETWWAFAFVGMFLMLCASCAFIWRLLVAATNLKWSKRSLLRWAIPRVTMNRFSYEFIIWFLSLSVYVRIFEMLGQGPFTQMLVGCYIFAASSQIFNVTYASLGIPSLFSKVKAKQATSH